MTSPNPRNIAASVHQRLLNKSQESARPFNELFQYYAIERFLYRFSRSSYAEKFILKGALMLMVWEVRSLRSTMDIDMLGKIKNSTDSIIAMVREVCLQKVEPDGIVFDPDSIRGQIITEEADYEGVRVHFRGLLGNARITLQLDIGFGDVVIPSPEMMAYPTILDLPAPKIRGYSKESMIAEKFEAMVRRGIINSRMKDFWDIRLLSQRFDFDGNTLATAIKKTFSTRHTTIPMNPIAFTEIFMKDEMKYAQWKAFCRKNRMDSDSDTFEEVVFGVSLFLKPMVECIVNNQLDPVRWKAPGPWQR
ncbi:MAG: nucleotidyl transferase AbiEii/AbiGii toxin family protein [Thermodesulfobacteriota bacterium]